MNDRVPLIEYESPKPARKRVPGIFWWFLLDGVLLLGACIYLTAIYDGLPYDREPPSSQLGTFYGWMFATLALLMFLLGWVACGWWRTRRASGGSGRGG